MNKLLNFTTEKSIILYQNYISKHKGYCCAHNGLHNEGSCSTWALNTVRNQGAIFMVSQFKNRLMACKKAAITISANEKDKNNENPACIATEVACCFLSS